MVKELEQRILDYLLDLGGNVSINPGRFSEVFSGNNPNYGGKQVYGALKKLVRKGYLRNENGTYFFYGSKINRDLH